MRQQFHIDKITNSIEDAVTGKSFETEVTSLTLAGLKTTTKKNGWRFNWEGECQLQGRQLYKLTVAGSETIQGLISVQPIENYIEMHLVETAPHNYGKFKKYAGVAGNLVAFACKMSFDAGFEGLLRLLLKHNLFSITLIL